MKRSVLEVCVLLSEVVDPAAVWFFGWIFNGGLLCIALDDVVGSLSDDVAFAFLSLRIFQIQIQTNRSRWAAKIPRMFAHEFRNPPHSVEFSFEGTR